jgi:NitT/TauT family transport system permease protein
MTQAEKSVGPGTGVPDPALATVDSHVAPPLSELSGAGRSRGMSGRWSAFLLPAGALVVLCSVWEWAGATGLVSRLVLPRPSAIATGFVGLFETGIIWPHLEATVVETLAGFAIGAGLGFVLAVFSSFWTPFRQMISPYMVALQVMPRVALAPIFLTWFGFGMAPKIVMAATICFFPVFINTLTGLLARDEQTLEMFQSMGASKMQVFREFTLPAALPITFAGLKTGLTLALIGAIVGEFVATDVGLGHLLERFTFRLAMDQAFAVLLVLTIVGLLLYGIAELLDRKIVFWTHESRLAHHRTRSSSPTTGA